MKAGIVVLLECRDGATKKSSLEALALALRMKADVGGTVTAALVGGSVKSAAEELATSGADKVVAVQGGGLALYSTEAYRDAALEVIRAADPGVILVASTVLGRDLAPAIASPNALDCAYAAESTAVEVVDGELRITRPVYAGKALLTVSAENPPVVIGIRPNVFDATLPGGGSATVEKLTPAFADTEPSSRVTAVNTGSKGTMDVAEADVVVAGGRGMGGPEGFQALEKLADILGGAVGASRAVVDLGWRPHSEQVGQTGKVVSPKLYIACGISGAIQHLAGMRTSKVIVAINKDAEAPIFKVADYGIVGDVNEVLPVLTEALQAACGN